MLVSAKLMAAVSGSSRNWRWRKAGGKTVKRKAGENPRSGGANRSVKLAQRERNVGEGG